MISKNCLACKKEFSVYKYRKNTANFCSTKCSNGFKSRTVSEKFLTCSQCHKEFFNKYWGTKNKFCSLKCFGKSISKKITKFCLTCNKEFKTAIHKGDRENRGKYCCKKCFFLAQQDRVVRNCIICHKEFFIWPSEVKNGSGQFCSRECFHRGNIEEKHWEWKGDRVGYAALHDWVYSRLGSPTQCEHCNKTGLTGHAIHWANASGFYKRDLSDWLRLCVKCHSAYDKGTGGKKRFVNS